MRQTGLLLGSVALAAITLSGCIEVHQEIHVNHDGSGKIVERISVTPRGYRMMKGYQARTGKKAEGPALLSDEFFRKRSASMGELEVKSRKEKDLPDGTKEMEVVYTFKDINKIHVWSIPTLRYMKPDGKEPCLDGMVKFDFKKGPRDRWGKRYREELYVPTLLRVRHLRGREPLTPAELQKYKDIVPIFQDMLKDFHVTITIIPPIERFEERGMVERMPVAKPNRVKLLDVDGEALVNNPVVLRMFLSNTLPGGGIMESRIPRMVPGSATPWFHNYHHKYVRFCKTEKVR